MAPPAQAAPADDSQLYNPLRTVGLGAALSLVLVRFGMVHELLAYAFGARFMLQYVFGIPALVALLASGGLGRVYRHKVAFFWTAYAVWLFVASPFSTWKSSSLNLAWSYFRAEFVLFLVMAGLAMTWGECKTMLRTAAVGGILALLAARHFQNAVLARQERFALAFGTVADPNDFACSLLLLLPIMLWLCLSFKSVALRLALLPVVPYTLYRILSTGSRGGLLGLLVEVAVFVFFGSWRQRFALLMLGIITVPIAVATLPSQTLRRITNFSGEAQETDGTGDEGAAESRTIRQYILKKSIEYTFRYPLFGVGPGQMVNFAGQRSKGVEGYGIWQNAHNMWIQASSECGIPALIFFLGGIVSSYRLLSATYRKARARPDCEDIRKLVVYVIVALVGFCTAGTFLNFAYLFYAPSLGALAIVISSAAAREFEARGSGAAASPAGGNWTAVPSPAWNGARN